jgi:hypothetical protein
MTTDTIDFDAIEAQHRAEIVELDERRSSLSLEAITDDAKRAELDDTESRTRVVQTELERVAAARAEHAQRETARVAAEERARREDLLQQVRDLNEPRRLAARKTDRALHAFIAALVAYKDVGREQARLLKTSMWLDEAESVRLGELRTRRMALAGEAAEHNELDEAIHDLERIALLDEAESVRLNELRERRVALRTVADVDAEAGELNEAIDEIERRADARADRDLDALASYTEVKPFHFDHALAAAIAAAGDQDPDDQSLWRLFSDLRPQMVPHDRREGFVASCLAVDPPSDSRPEVEAA